VNKLNNGAKNDQIPHKSPVARAVTTIVLLSEKRM